MKQQLYFLEKENGFNICGSMDRNVNLTKIYVENEKKKFCQEYRVKYGYDFLDVYPHIKKYDMGNVVLKNMESFEETKALEDRKNMGQFLTNDVNLIGYMIKDLDLLSGKILEPSCGTGDFLVFIVKKMIVLLKNKKYSEEKILDYIIENVYANDLDDNALMISELRVLSVLSELINNVKIKNPKYNMKKLNFYNFDYLEKNKFNKKFSIIIGNPPYVTFYGRRSRNMTEEKRKYFNTFDFVQNKKGNNKFNISMFFIENSLKYLRDGGHLKFILDMSFLETAFIDIRKYIVQNYYITSLTYGIQSFKGVSSGQIIIDVRNFPQYNRKITLYNFEKNDYSHVSQILWDNKSNDYKFNEPLSERDKKINGKINKYKVLEYYFPGKSLRTCCALTGRTDDFVVDKQKETDNIIFPYLEGSKSIKEKFSLPVETKYIEYNYELQLKISEEFRKELELKGVKNKKRVTLGDKEAYLSPKLFIRQSANELIATYTDKPYAANNSLYILTRKKNDHESIDELLYVCGLLNSELLSYYAKINKIIRTGKGKTPQIKISDLKKLPININGKYYTDVIDCVKKLLIEKDRKTYFELNSLVYKIYDISNEEIDAVREYLNLLE